MSELKVLALECPQVRASRLQVPVTLAASSERA